MYSLNTNPNPNYIDDDQDPHVTCTGCVSITSDYMSISKEHLVLPDCPENIDFIYSFMEINKLVLNAARNYFPSHFHLSHEARYT